MLPPERSGKRGRTATRNNRQIIDALVGFYRHERRGGIYLMNSDRDKAFIHGFAEGKPGGYGNRSSNIFLKIKTKKSSSLIVSLFVSTSMPPEQKGATGPSARTILRRVQYKNPHQCRCTGQSDAVSFDTEIFGLCFATADQKEGMQAFAEKRKANFTESKAVLGQISAM